MKEEAREVLHTAISDGFGFKMLAKMGWKPGEGLGKEASGIADPIWVEPREGKCGLFAEDEIRPKKLQEGEELPPTMFLQAGETPKDRPPPGQGSEPPAKRAKPARPTAQALAPALLEFLLRPDHLQQIGGTSSVAEILGEVLSGEVGERFVKLVDERLGPRVAPCIAAQAQDRRRVTPWGFNAREAALVPLWHLTQHHVPGEHDQ